MDIYNVVGGKHLIDEDLWAVSIVRKKTDHGAEHAFLIIEGIKEKEYKIIRADLYVKQRTTLGSSAISGQSGLEMSNTSGAVSAKSIPGSSGKIILFSSQASGQAKIVMKDLLLKDLQALERECESKTFGISVAQAESLIADIEADIGAKIGYNLCGDGSSYSCSFLRQRYHSCVSWAMEKLAKIDCKVEGAWHDFVIKITSKIIPDYKAEDKESSGCRLM